MADLIETEQWEATIYQLETTDPVKGGNDGISNRQGKQLANRTAYLKQQVELKAPVASPTFTGTPAAPTAEADTSTTQLATTEFVLGQVATVAPVMDGTATVGTSKKFARQDHVHPTDTSRAPVASPTFTGTPAAPTAAANTNTTQLATTAFVLSQGTSIVGSARNQKCAITAASSTATFTADEVIVETAIGGLKYQISNLNKIINLAITGAGGMDTGSAPASGYVAIYAILNTTTGVSALLGVNATSAVAPEVYGGSNMPSGYTASALLAVWPTNSSCKFIEGYWAARKMSIVSTNGLTTTATHAGYASASLSGVVPLNAKSIRGHFVTVATNGYIVTSSGVASSSDGINALFSAGLSQASQCQFEIPVITAQTMFYVNVVSGGPISSTITIAGYEI